jgi:hypothetical protein
LTVTSGQPVLLDAVHLVEPFSSSHFWTEAQSQAVVLLPSFTGFGNCPAATQRHSVGADTGTIPGTRFLMRMNPFFGK